MYFHTKTDNIILETSLFTKPKSSVILYLINGSSIEYTVLGTFQRDAAALDIRMKEAVKQKVVIVSLPLHASEMNGVETLHEWTLW